MGPSEAQPGVGNANGGLQRDIRPIREKQFQMESIRVIVNYLNEAGYKHTVDERLFQMPTAKEYHAIFKFVFQRLEPGKDIPKIEEIVNILRWMKCVLYEALKLRVVLLKNQAIVDQVYCNRYPYAHEISKSSLQAVGNVQTWPNLLGRSFIYGV